ncbi:hypothetical protein ABPG75_013307 [Micractinium tetrahymenae]
MSTPTRATRRSTRAAAAAAAEATSSPSKSPAKDSLVSPVASHPIHEEPELSPKPARRRSNGSKEAEAAKSGGSPPAYLLLAVLIVAGGVLYTQYVQPRLGSGSWAPADQPQPKPAPQSVPAEAQGAAQPQPQPPLPRVVFTREEEEVFEKACEEHYNLPPSAPLLPGEEGPEAAAAADRALLEAEGDAQPVDEIAEAVVEGKEAEAEAGERQPVDPDRDTGAHAADFFDPEVHAQYLALPAWPEATEEELTGSWKLTEEVYDYAASHPMAQVLSREKPRVMLLPSFLSPEEVDHMIKISRDNLERSEVLVAEGQESVNDVRTSFGFWPETDDVIARITERIHRTIGVPEKFGEGLYVLNYQHGQKYEAHNDHCMDGPQGTGNHADAACLDFLKRAGGPQCGPGRGGATCGDRVATFILYLKSPTRGGHTAFPEAQATREAMGAEHRPGNSPDEWYCSDERVLSAAPAAGTAVLFWDYRPGNGSGAGSYEDGSAQAEAQTVYEAMHAGCPVWEGEKYIATRWIRSSGFDYNLERNAPVAAAA